MNKQADLFGLVDDNGLPSPGREEAFDGETYVPDRDYERMGEQLARVYEVMLDGRWHTLGNIALNARGSEAACSARLRDLRKEKYGSREILRRYVRDGLWEYRMKIE
jgi:hypothetical protein